MTYDVYAIYPEGSYLVATATDQKHGTDFAEHILKGLGIVPMAVATLTRGEHTIRGEIFTFDDLYKKYRK
jgi:hypothetical protein